MNQAAVRLADSGWRQRYRAVINSKYGITEKGIAQTWENFIALYWGDARAPMLVGTIQKLYTR